MPDSQGRITCPVCGYSCVPQWMNDDAHCLKCQAVVMKRPTCHERGHDTVTTEVTEAIKYSPDDAMEHDSGKCKASPTGMHHWKFGKCSYCQKPEGELLAGSTPLHPGERVESARMLCHVCGYNSVPQWLNDNAHCLKCDAILKTRPSCHDQEDGAGTRRTGEEASMHTYAPSSAMESESGTCKASPTGKHLFRFGKCSYCQQPEGQLRPGSTDVNPGSRDDLHRMECHVCGYICVPQWLNDNAHCLKCDAILKTRSSCHDRVPRPAAKAAPEAHLVAGEVSTYKYSPSDALESESGTCRASPNGMHHWKFGKCSYCQQPEGHLRPGSTAMNPGRRDDLPRMECHVCGYKCVPQWLNDNAHCLKCDAILLTRPSCHNQEHESATTAVHELQRAPGEVSTQRSDPSDAVCGLCELDVSVRPALLASRASDEIERIEHQAVATETQHASGEVATRSKYAPSSAMESESGECKASPNGKHHWKFGKCSYCKQPEGQIYTGSTPLKPDGRKEGSRMECHVCGYKCVPQWLNDNAHCLKCDAILLKRRGKEVGPVHEMHRSPGEVSTHKRSPGDAMESDSGKCNASPNGIHHWRFGKCSYCQQPEGQLRLGSTDASPGKRDQLQRMECHVCGYTCVPQWLNDNAHCLKCDSILQTRSSCQDQEHGTEVRSVHETHRAPGEVSTYKRSPGDAMESQSGKCNDSPDGIHHWRFGKCTYCQQPQGRLVSEAGSAQNPGGHDACARGGKCLFKFAKCTKCGRGEAGVSVSSARPVSRNSSDRIKDAFQRFDADGNGVISLSELKAVLQRLPALVGGEAFTEAEFNKFLEAIDENHDGVIDYSEFANWLHNDSDTAGIVMKSMKVTRACSPKAAAKAKPKASPGPPSLDGAPGRSSPAPKSAVRGPERFFYDKGSYTGTHARGGPEHVAVGEGTSHDQSWKRPG